MEDEAAADGEDACPPASDQQAPARFIRSWTRCLPADWDPGTDLRLTAWEVVHQLIRALEAGGEGAAAELVGKLDSKAEIARELAYRLYALCERKKRAAEALSYNGLVQSWPEISRLAREGAKEQTERSVRL